MSLPFRKTAILFQSSVFVKYFSSSIILTIVGIISGFFTYRYVEPSLTGVFALFSVYEIYASFARLGIINGLGRELPLLSGMNKIEEAKKMASTALFYSLFSNFLLILAIPVILTEKKIDLSDNNYVLTLIVVVVRLVISSYSSYLSVTFRTTKHFIDLSRINIYLAIIRLLSVLLIVYFNFLGLLLRELLMSLLEMLLLHWKRPMNIHPKLYKSELIHLFKIGFPLFIVSYLTSLIDTIPRLYLIKYGTIEQLGLFSPIMIIVNLAGMLPKSLNSYMYPKMTFEYGFSQDKRKVWSIVIRTYKASILSAIPIFLVVYCFSDYIYLVFPKYSDTSRYLKIISFALLFIGNKSGNLIFSVLKSWNMMILNASIYFIVFLLSLIVLNSYLNDILMVASWSIVISFGIMYVATFILSYIVIKNRDNPRYAKNIL